MNSPMRRMLSNKSLWVKTFAYYAAFTALGLTTASLGPTLPGLAASTHSDLSRISFLFVLRSLGYLLGSYNAGRLYDQRTGNPIIAVALTGIAALLTFVPVIPILWIVAALLLLVGFAEGTVDVGGNTLMVWLHRDQVGPFMNGLHFTFGVGALLSPIIIAQTIAHSGGIRWAYWVLAVLIAPMAIWIFRIPSPPSQGSDPSVSIKPRRPLLVGLVLLFFFLYVGAETGYGGWIYTYAISTGLGSATSAAYLNSGFWAALTLGRLAAIPLSTRLRPPDVLAIDLLGCLASLTTVLAFPASQAALWAGTLGSGLFLASIFPTMMNLAQSQMTITGRLTSWFFVGASSGGMLLPWVVGQLIEPLGPQTVMWAIFGNLVLALCVFAAIHGYSRRSPSPTPFPPPTATKG